MHHLVASLILVFSMGTACIADVSSRPIVVMIDGENGAPLSSGTLMGDGDIVRVILPGRVIDQVGLCARFRDSGGCYLLIDAVELPGMDLVAAALDASFEEVQSEQTLERMSTTAIPPWVIAELDTLAEKAPIWIGRDGFTNWRRPLTPARVTGASETGFSLAHPDFGPLDEGGVVDDPQAGLIGVVGRAQDGRAGIIGSEVLFDAMLAAGLNIAADAMPTKRTSALPPAVDSEVGGFWVFFHYPDQEIGFASFYGPSTGSGFAGWGANFDTSVLYLVFSLSDHMQDGKSPPVLLTQSETRQTYGGSGWNLGAPFPGATPEYLATCVIHAVPSAGDRRIFQMTFWRQRSEQTFDQVAYSKKGWALDDMACQTAFANLGDARSILTAETVRTADPVSPVAPLQDDFELVSDPVSILPSAVAQIGDLVIGVTCGPGNRPIVFYRSPNAQAPHIMVDVYKANLAEWTPWQSGEITTYHAPLHPQAARGWAFGAGTSVTFNDRNTILMGGKDVSAAQTALSDCLE